MHRFTYAVIMAIVAVTIASISITFGKYLSIQDKESQPEEISATRDDVPPLQVPAETVTEYRNSYQRRVQELRTLAEQKTVEYHTKSGVPCAAIMTHAGVGLSCAWTAKPVDTQASLD